MTPSIALTALLLLASAHAQDDDVPADGAGDAGSDDAEPEDDLSRFRTPFDVLAERTIGTASTPVEFSWRRSRVMLAVTGDHYFELNNFNTIRGGGMARFESNGLLFEVGLSRAWVWDTPSSELLALTPYRQPGRPKRVEVDFNVGVPLAEGVVTTFPRFFPAAQLVLNAYGGIHYLVYPTGFQGLKIREVGAALIAPALSAAELENLEDQRLDAMQVDPGRYGLMAGFGNDIYFKQGLFISPRAMFSVPLLAPVSGSQLLFWADFSLAIGVAL
ncbi:MAG: hypothetical protein P8R54_30690 [Myxococcota bacterium]|nr:hypothetical protein [Myxococcota bacterium]